MTTPGDDPAQTVCEHPDAAHHVHHAPTRTLDRAGRRGRRGCHIRPITDRMRVEDGARRGVPFEVAVWAAASEFSAPSRPRLRA